MNRLLGKCNRYILYAFLFFQLVIITGMGCNGEIDYPMRSETYLEKGGNLTDYYLGYWLYTHLDTGIYTRTGDHLFRFVTAGIPCLLIGILWLLGTGFAYSKENDSLLKEVKPKPLLAIFATLCSLYYIYYSYVYLSHFWLM